MREKPFQSASGWTSWPCYKGERAAGYSSCSARSSRREASKRASSSQSKKAKKKKRKKKDKKETEEGAAEAKEDEDLDGRRPRRVNHKQVKQCKTLVRRNGARSQRKIRRRVAKRAGKHFKKRSAKSSSSHVSSRSSSASSSVDEVDTKGTTIFSAASNVKQIYEACPGVLACQTLVHMRQALLQTLGEEDETGSPGPPPSLQRSDAEGNSNHLRGFTATCSPSICEGCSEPTAQEPGNCAVWLRLERMLPRALLG